MITIDRTALHIGGASLHWYGVLIVLGIALGGLQGAKRERRLGLKDETTLDLLLCGVPAAIVGARAYYVAFSWEAFADGPWTKVFAVWEGGLAIYGGLIGALLAGMIYARATHQPFLRLTDLAAPGFAIGQAVGRWGNFLNGEAYGAPVTDPRLQFFPAAVNVEGAWYYAAFFYESAWCALIAAFLLIAERRGRFRRDGECFASYALLYGLERAAVEGLRADSLYLGALRVSQLLSLTAVLAAALYLAARRDAPKAARCALPACAALLPVAFALKLPAAALLFGALTLCAYLALTCKGR